MCRSQIMDSRINGVALIPGDDRDQEIRIKTCLPLLDKDDITNMAKHAYLAAVVFKS